MASASSSGPVPQGMVWTQLTMCREQGPVAFGLSRAVQHRSRWRHASCGRRVQRQTYLTLFSCAEVLGRLLDAAPTTRWGLASKQLSRCRQQRTAASEGTSGSA